LDTQESESESIKKMKQAGKDIVIPESGTVRKPAGSGVASGSEDMIKKEGVGTKNETVCLAVDRLKKGRPSVRDEVNTCLGPRKR
jgi:hypothetical protein